MWGVIAGIAGGIVAGMGMGGGTLLIPILTIFLSWSQINAQGINLIAFLPMSIVAIYLHYKNNLVQFKQTWVLAICGAAVSVGSAFLANIIDDALLKKLFGIFLLILGIWQIFDGINCVKSKKKLIKK